MDGKAGLPSGQPYLWQCAMRDHVQYHESFTFTENASWTRTANKLDCMWNTHASERQCPQTESLFNNPSLSRPLHLDAPESQQSPVADANGNRHQSDVEPSDNFASCSFAAADDEDDDPLHELERHRQAFGQQMMMEANAHGAGAPGASIQSRVPLDSDGKPTSIGSIGHANGTCTVCIFANTPSGCSNGVECGFCHLEHRRTRQKNKMRPCKGKRERHQKFLSRLKMMIETNPHSFSLEQVVLPPSIAGNEAVKAKLVAQVRQHVEQVKASLEGVGTASSFFGT
mmetsp:Transcript_75991/g.146839  ORF Transcript_75991/g.146839 Transcript_75991/m.146839 type:complete len:285 (-) Transcript_75991:5-859(-)